MMWSDTVRYGGLDGGWFASLFILMEKTTFLRNFAFYVLNKMKKIGNERSSLKAVLQNLNVSESGSYHFNASSSFHN